MVVSLSRPRVAFINPRSSNPLIVLRFAEAVRTTELFFKLRNTKLLPSAWLELETVLKMGEPILLGLGQLRGVRGDGFIALRLRLQRG
jgi:hypothetical protein